LCNFVSADAGAVGGSAESAAVQLGGGRRVVSEPHGRRLLVAPRDLHQVSEPDGAADVPKTLPPDHLQTAAAARSPLPQSRAADGPRLKLERHQVHQHASQPGKKIIR